MSPLMLPYGDLTKGRAHARPDGPLKAVLSAGIATGALEGLFAVDVLGDVPKSLFEKRVNESLTRRGPIPRTQACWRALTNRVLLNRARVKGMGGGSKHEYSRTPSGTMVARRLARKVRRDFPTFLKKGKAALTRYTEASRT